MDLLIQISWVLFGLGIIITLIGVFGIDLGDYIGVDTFTLASAFVFFGAGNLVMSYFTDSLGMMLLVSITATTVLLILVHFLFVGPMKKARSSVSVSKGTQIGGIAVVLTTIPANAYGEIQMEDKLFRDGQMARSSDNKEIKQGTRVVVIDIQDHVFFVSPLHPLDGELLR